MGVREVTRRALLAGTGALAAGGTLCWPTTGAWGATSVEQEILAWLKRNRRRFDAARPASIMADGAMLKALAGAKVIGIGEATHGSHEDVACKAEIIKALVQADAIGTLFLEANSAGSRQLDAFIAGSEGTAADRVTSADIFRVLKTEALIDILDWLRSWNRTAKAPVRIIGVDCQATAADTAFALEWLKSLDAATAADFARRLEPLVNPEARAMRYVNLVTSLTTQQLRQGMRDLEDLQKVLAADGAYAAAPGRSGAAQSARMAWQGLSMLEYDVSDGKIEGDVDAYYGRRDAYMAENINHFADDRPGTYWAHNLHVAGASVAYESGAFNPTGHHLRQALGERYRTILFEYASARFNAVPIRDPAKTPPATDPTVVIDWPYREGRMAGLFRSLGGGDAWVNLQALPSTPPFSDWSTRPQAKRDAGYAAIEKVDDAPLDMIKPRPAIDILVHIEALTPSRMRL
jgi:erythromycin esterase